MIEAGRRELADEARVARQARRHEVALQEASHRDFGSGVARAVRAQREAVVASVEDHRQLVREQAMLVRSQTSELSRQLVQEREAWAHRGASIARHWGPDQKAHIHESRTNVSQRKAEAAHLLKEASIEHEHQVASEHLGHLSSRQERTEQIRLATAAVVTTSARQKIVDRRQHEAIDVREDARSLRHTKADLEDAYLARAAFTRLATAEIRENARMRRQELANERLQRGNELRADRQRNEETVAETIQHQMQSKRAAHDVKVAAKLVTSAGQSGGRTLTRSWSFPASLSGAGGAQRRVY